MTAQYSETHKALVWVSVIGLIVLGLAFCAFYIHWNKQNDLMRLELMAIADKTNQVGASIIQLEHRIDRQGPRALAIQTMDKPVYSRQEIATWAAMRMMETMTFGYHDYELRMQQASEHYTKEGWQFFLKAMEDSGVLQSVVDNKMLARAYLNGAPVILREGVVAGRYEWRIEIPLNMEYQGGDVASPINSPLRAVVTIQRTNPEEGFSDGLVIKSWRALIEGDNSTQ